MMMTIEVDRGDCGMESQARINPSDETIRIGPLGIHFILASGDTNGNASVFELFVPAGQRVPAPPHKNDSYEEILYGLEGVLTWMVDGRPVPVGPGQALCIRRGETHGFINQSESDARQLVVIAPSIMGPAYFRDVAAAIKAAAGSPPNPAQVAAIMKRHGMTVVAPA
jgi:quercetin dioxygenase-like cupin family protein